jgi:ABC-type polysaccharide/polyol phosphate transport system ATPase subunit
MKRHPLIELRNLSLDLPTSESRNRSLKNLVLSKLGGHVVPNPSRNILSNIDLKIFRGESLSVIGKNGSGKSSLLRVLSEIYSPSAGLLVGAPSRMPLIELDGAFNGELTVLENIDFLSILLGVHHKRISSIRKSALEFSELQNFASQPMRTLSTGMKARFAFAFATSIECELIFIDESLSVGDYQFSKKANARIRELKKKGVTLVLVTHDLILARRFTSKCLWLEEGSTRLYGSTKFVIGKYQNSD